MRFTVHCPKCSSPRVSLQMDRDTVFFHNGTGRPYLHCAHCGNVLYDNKAIEAIEQQKNAFDLKVAEAEQSRKQKLEQERIDRELRLQKKPEETLSPNAALSTREVGVLIKTRTVSTPVATTMPTLAPQPPKATVAAVKPVEAPQAPVKVSAKAAKPAKPAKAEKPVKAESLDANAVRKAVKAKKAAQMALTASTVRAAVETKRIVEPLPTGVRLIPCGNVTADQLSSDVVLSILKRGINGS